MSRSREQLEAQLREANPLFGARQGSQTLELLAQRNNISRQTLEIYAQAQARAEEQERAFRTLRVRQLEQEQVEAARTANVEAEAGRIRQLALDSVGDERTRQIFSEQGNSVISSTIQDNLQAQFQNLQASGDHLDNDGRLTLPAEALQRAIQLNDAGVQRELAQPQFAGDPTAIDDAQSRARRDAEAGPLRNFAQSAATSVARGLGGLPLQVGAAVAGDTGAGRFMGEQAARFNDFVGQFDIETPEERAFNEEFAASEGFGGALGTILSNPGQALQSFGADAAGAVGAGGLITGAGRGAAALVGNQLARRAGRDVAETTAQRAAARTASRAPAQGAGQRFVQGSQAAAPAVFAGGGAGFAEGAEQALNSETDNIASFARRGLATSAAGTLAAGAVGAVGGSTVDAPLFRARQARQTALPQGRLARTRNVGGEIGRGVAGESFQEGVEGLGQGISDQLGEGATLTTLDTQRLGADVGRSVAAGGTLGGATSAATGTLSTFQRRRTQEDAVRRNIQSATGTASTEGRGTRSRDNLSALDPGQNLNNTLDVIASADGATRANIFSAIGGDLDVQAPIDAATANDIVNRSFVDNAIDPNLLRSNVGQALGVQLRVNDQGQVERGPDTIVSDQQASQQTQTPSPQPQQTQTPLPTLNNPRGFDGNLTTGAGIGNVQDAQLQPSAQTVPNALLVAQQLQQNPSAQELPTLNNPRGFDGELQTDPNAPTTVGDPLQPTTTPATPSTVPNPAPEQGLPTLNNPRGFDGQLQTDPNTGVAQTDPLQPTADVTSPELANDPSLQVLNVSNDASIATDPTLDPAIPAEVGDRVLPPVGTNQNADPVEGLQQTAVDPTTTTEGQVPDTEVTGAQGTDDNAAIELEIGNVRAVQRARRDNDGTPQAQALEDFTTGLFRQQVANGQRNLGENDIRAPGQVFIANRIQELTDGNPGIDSNSARAQATADFRALRESEVDRIAQGLPVRQEPEPTTISETADTFTTQPEELGFSIDPNSPREAQFNTQLTNAIVASFSTAAIRRKQANPEAGAIIRQSQIQAQDVSSDTNLAAAREIVKRIRTDVSRSFTLPNDSFTGGSARLTRKASASDARIQALQERLVRDTTRLRELLTPEGYQRIFGKKQ